MDSYHLTIHLSGEPQEFVTTINDDQVILEGLGNNILEHLGDIALGRSIKIFLRDREDKVFGGIIGSMFGGWAYISLLWVHESLRNLGFGTQLLQRFEREATRLGCTGAHVDTYSFEAAPFYEKAGYVVFARLDNYPPGHCKYFLKKTFVENK